MSSSSSLTSRLAEEDYVRGLETTCRLVIERSLEERRIFRQIYDMALVHSFEDVEAVMLETHVEENWDRAAVFITWLLRHDDAFEYWRRLVHKHPEVWTRAVCELAIA